MTNNGRFWVLGAPVLKHAQALIGLVAVCLAVSTSAGSETRGHFADAIEGENRTATWVVRDRYRHPAETLAFFELGPEMTVVEIWPGGGWYSEILGPYLASGKLYAAQFPLEGRPEYYRRIRTQFEEKLAAYPGVYPTTEVVEFDPANDLLETPDGSVDRVLTFRNVHNWLRSKSEARAFELFFKALKPGGVLGVVEHRAPAGTSWDAMKTSGYMTEAYVIELAEQAGFVFDGRSEINANPKDTANHPEGVWTLPPSLRLKEKDREKYLAIGESDRMTLRFKKPELAETDAGSAAAPAR